MFTRFSFCLLLLILAGCGAKTVAPELSTHVDKFKLSEGEGVIITLDEYTYDGKYEDELSERILKHIKMQQDIQKCFAKAAKKSGLIVNSPISLLHDPLLGGYGAQKDIRRGNEPKNELKGPNNLLGMRYLVSTKIETFYSGDTDFAAEGDEYILIVGAAKTGTKSTKANLTIHDIKTGDQVDNLWINSSGKQGWTAGVAVLYILPVPWYWPWWSMTETETCTAIGETVVKMFSPLQEN